MAVDTIARGMSESGGGGGDISGKADKVSGATSGDLAGLNSSGNLTDSGYAPSDFAPATTIITDNASTTYDFVLADLENTEVRLLANNISAISFTFSNDALQDKYLSGLSFAAGSTPPQISYIGTGVLNWVGTDCTVSGTDSIFQPSANTQYDIVFYYNGRQIIGLVNGYVPANGNQ